MDKELLKMLGILIGLAVVLSSVAGIFAYFISKAKCNSAYENFQPQFTIFSGCRVMVDGKLTPVDIVRELK